MLSPIEWSLHTDDIEQPVDHVAGGEHQVPDHCLLHLPPVSPGPDHCHPGQCLLVVKLLPRCFHDQPQSQGSVEQVG